MSDRVAKVRQGRSNAGQSRRDPHGKPARPESSRKRPKAVSGTEPSSTDGRPVVAVTGAAHDLGLALTARLAQSDRFSKVVAIDAHRGELTGVTWRVVDIRDPVLAGRLAGIDVIVHTDLDLAPDTDSRTRRAYNVRGAQTVLTAAAAGGVGRVVLVTSAMVYGASPDNPVPDAAHAGQSPIKHVLYIVRENRTYDQVYGDLGKTRSDANADPAYEYLASAAPQGHAIVSQFASSDNFFSDGEASVQGHWWTTSANVTDWIEKAWRLNYSARNRGTDFLDPVAEPERCSLFQSALAKQVQSGGSFTLRNYGEFFGAVTPDGNGLPVSSPCSPFLGANSARYTGPVYTDTTPVPCTGATPPAGCGRINSLLSVGNFPVYSYTDLGYPSAINGDANLSVDDRLGAAAPLLRSLRPR